MGTERRELEEEEDPIRGVQEEEEDNCSQMAGEGKDEKWRQRNKFVLRSLLLMRKAISFFLSFFHPNQDPTTLVDDRRKGGSQKLVSHGGRWIDVGEETTV